MEEQHTNTQEKLSPAEIAERIDTLPGEVKGRADAYATVRKNYARLYNKQDKNSDDLKGLTWQRNEMIAYQLAFLNAPNGKKKESYWVAIGAISQDDLDALAKPDATGALRKKLDDHIREIWVQYHKKVKPATNASSRNVSSKEPAVTTESVSLTSLAAGETSSAIVPQKSEQVPVRVTPSRILRSGSSEIVNSTGNVTGYTSLQEVDDRLTNLPTFEPVIREDGTINLSRQSANTLEARMQAYMAGDKSSEIIEQIVKKHIQPFLHVNRATIDALEMAEAFYGQGETLNMIGDAEVIAKIFDAYGQSKDYNLMMREFLYTWENAQALLGAYPRYFGQATTMQAEWVQLQQEFTRTFTDSSGKKVTDEAYNINRDKGKVAKIMTVRRFYHMMEVVALAEGGNLEKAIVAQEQRDALYESVPLHDEQKDDLDDERISIEKYVTGYQGAMAHANAPTMQIQFDMYNKNRAQLQSEVRYQRSQLDKLCSDISCNYDMRGREIKYENYPWYFIRDTIKIARELQTIPAIYPHIAELQRKIDKKQDRVMAKKGEDYDSRISQAINGDEPYSVFCGLLDDGEKFFFLNNCVKLYSIMRKAYETNIEVLSDGGSQATVTVNESKHLIGSTSKGNSLVQQ